MCDLDRQRAAFAWQRVDEAVGALGGNAGREAEAYKSYKNLAKAAPALIMNNGLMQTLAFFTSKGKAHHLALRDDMLEWLSGAHCHLPVPQDYPQAMGWLHGAASSEQYRLATEETMNLLRWLRQFADS